MHEFGIVDGILSIVKETAIANSLSNVSSIKLRIGEMRQIASEMLLFAFEIAAKETVAEDAKLDIEYVPVRLRCRSCQSESEIKDSRFICPSCGNMIGDVVAGKELQMISLEGE